MNLHACVVVLSVISVCYTADEPRIITQVGEILGSSVSVEIDGRTYIVDQYLGIHYAKPPVGDLRFRKPVPYGKLNSPYYANNFGYICPQIYYSMEPVIGTEDEDCLHLNVFVPRQDADGPSGHAVMVWIYGGAFILGSSDAYDCKTLSSVGNVIVVTLNYRVGPLGFLSSQDSNLPGNLGLWDQRLALEWVRDNIGSFGGDTGRITIFGESAGAISSVMHGMFPGNAGLFQRIIAESGAPSIRSMNCSRQTKQQLRIIADTMDCGGADISAIVSCLRTKPWRDFMNQVNAMTENFENILAEYLVFDPVVDGEFIKYEPRDLSYMARNQAFDDISERAHKQALEELEFFRQFDFLSGMNAYEGAIYIPFYSQVEDYENFEPTPEDFRNLLSVATALVFNRTFPNAVMKMIENEYTDWANPGDFNNIRLQYTKLYGDTGFAVAAVEYARLHLSSVPISKTYMYKFMPVPTARQPGTPSWTPGANHGEELQYVFGVDGQPNVSQWEITLSRLMMKYWSNFAKTGNPNGAETDVTWPEYTMDTQYYLEFDHQVTKDSVKQFLYAREYEFWLGLFPTVVAAMDEKGSGPHRHAADHSHGHEDL